MRALLITFLLVSCSACDGQRLGQNVELKGRPTIILIPGYYGTRLTRVPDGKLMWVSAAQGLFGNQSLALPLKELGLENMPQLRPDGILKEVTIVPFLYSIDGYGSMLDALQKSGASVIPFDYDWRGDLFEAVQRLNALILALQREGTQNIVIVAHSMGGLVASYYLRYGAQDMETAVETWEGADRVTRVVMAGVPYLGSITVFRNMTYGRSVGLNNTLLDYRAVASFPASYYTLPMSELDFLLAPDGRPRKGMIGDQQNWTQYQWGLLRESSSLSKEVVDRRAGYTSYWLHRAARFSELIRAPVANRSRPARSLLYLYAKGVPTLMTGRWMDHHAVGIDSIRFDENSATQVDGDGTVTIQSASLPEAYRETFHVTVRGHEVSHGELMNASDIQQDIIAFLGSDGEGMKP